MMFFRIGEETFITVADGVPVPGVVGSQKIPGRNGVIGDMARLLFQEKQNIIVGIINLL